MDSVFNKNQDIRNDVRQNKFDWSHDNNFTTELGRITPIFCERVPPKSSIRISPTYGLKFMPMMFPIQTRMKAYLSFYKVPLRTLWTDYMDWISSANDPDSNLDPPYITPSAATAFGRGNIFGVSGLSDYFSVPITSTPKTVVPINDYGVDPNCYTFHSAAASGFEPLNVGQTYTNGRLSQVQPAPVGTASKFLGIWIDRSGFADVADGTYEVTFEVTFQGSPATVATAVQSLDSYAGGGMILYSTASSSISACQMRDMAWIKNWYVEEIDSKNSKLHCVFNTLTWVSRGKANSSDALLLIVRADTAFVNAYSGSSQTLKFDKKVTAHPVEGGTLSQNSCPYAMDSYDDGTRIRLSAYPYRAYEAIYNGYIRNIRNNPFMLNGKATYNRYVTNLDGGADRTNYQLYYANWASDQFTTALPSPQQGQAPLVGLTTYETHSVNEQGHTFTEIKTALVDEDGKKYGVEYESNGESLKGVKYTALDSNTPVRPVSSLYDVVTSGISINDFRNVNAYQRYLELNQMRGFSYKDIIEGRFDVNVRYDALQLPEYIGGFTRDISVNPVTQTVETADSGSYQGSLGSQAGLAGCYGESDASISVFCDEESIVMGLIWIVPMPCYSQVLPKHFLYRERLDSFQPEFDQIGYQPVTYRELCPVEAFNSGHSPKLDTVFGYQRPWYEYCQKLDSVHGLFRTSLQNFIMSRVFGAVPELGASFTVVDPEQVNNVFSVTDTTDKIYGQIHFDVTAKLPISRVVVPRLE